MAPKIQYTDEQVSDAAARSRLREGWYKFVIRDAEATISATSKHLMLVSNDLAMEDHDDTSSAVTPGVKNRLVLPFANSDEEGHVGPNTSGFCIQWARALLGSKEIPYYPKRDPKTQKLSFGDEEITEEQAGTIRKQILKKVFDQVIAWYDDPALLTGKVYYGLVEHSGDYAQVAKMEYSLPPKTECVPKGHFIVKN